MDMMTFVIVMAVLSFIGFCVCVTEAYAPGLTLSALILIFSAVGFTYLGQESTTTYSNHPIHEIVRQGGNKVNVTYFDEGTLKVSSRDDWALYESSDDKIALMKKVVQYNYNNSNIIFRVVHINSFTVGTVEH